MIDIEFSISSKIHRSIKFKVTDIEKIEDSSKFQKIIKTKYNESVKHYCEMFKDNNPEDVNLITYELFCNNKSIPPCLMKTIKFDTSSIIEYKDSFQYYNLLEYSRLLSSFISIQYGEISMQLVRKIL